MIKYIIFFTTFVPTIKKIELKKKFLYIYSKIEEKGLKKESYQRLPSERNYEIPKFWQEMNQYEPIHVNYISPNNYSLIDGRHRLFKLILLGKEKVNAIVHYPT